MIYKGKENTMNLNHGMDESLTEADLLKAKADGSIEAIYDENGFNEFLKVLGSASFDELVKAKKDISKLVRKTIVTKSGVRKTVWVKPAGVDKPEPKKEKKISGSPEDIKKGKKDISKLVKKQIVTKNGIRKTIWVSPKSARVGSAELKESKESGIVKEDGWQGAQACGILF